MIWERERNINLLFHLFMHSLVDSCTCPDQNWTRNLGILGQHSNQLSYPARATLSFLIALSKVSDHLSKRCKRSVETSFLYFSLIVSIAYRWEFRTFHFSAERKEGNCHRKTFQSLEKSVDEGNAADTADCEEDDGSVIAWAQLTRSLQMRMAQRKFSQTQELSLFPWGAEKSRPDRDGSFPRATQLSLCPQRSVTVQPFSWYTVGAALQDGPSGVCPTACS